MQLKGLFIILLISPGFLKAQSSNNADKSIIKKDSTVQDHPLKLGVVYTSNNVFMGRANTTLVPVISPDIKYSLKSGIYFSGAINVLPNSTSKKVDGGSLSAGYDFDITNNLSGTTSVSKLFYNTNSAIVGSSISGVFSAGLEYDIGSIITPSISFDYDTNTRGVTNDAFLSFGVSHDIITRDIFTGKDLLIISPSVATNFGSQNFYSGFITKKAFKSAKRTAAQNALVDQYQQALNKFHLLDYEISVPFQYKAGRFIFSLVPTYAIVKNQFESAAVTNALGLSNKSSVFYLSTGVALKF